jgi:hypothetical protein
MRVQREPRREPVARRHAYSAAFKLQVVREALLRPASNRIKPTCRDHPGIEPVSANPHPVGLAVAARRTPIERAARLMPTGHTAHPPTPNPARKEAVQPSVPRKCRCNSASGSATCPRLRRRFRPPSVCRDQVVGPRLGATARRATRRSMTATILTTAGATRMAAAGTSECWRPWLCGRPLWARIALWARLSRLSPRHCGQLTWATSAPRARSSQRSGILLERSIGSNR